LIAGRLARLGATPGFHPGLLAVPPPSYQSTYLVPSSATPPLFV
jgi:hypothetical protein